ncbi:OprD family porin [Pseudomonas sp. GD03944]|uniref:OprD family porin n=1 Tax=Pseudomonas sp. GD03944 TaxID=2975409 RepID=UPI00244BADD4|nr:OprD family porin [Pseudomonas sp. GD03944]MDH1265815.1 OprD family porin [Pseudomonas sp. GD03944]
MQVMKWSVIALAVAAGSTQMAVASSQSESKGFLEDSSFNIFNRVLYMNRDFKNGAANGASTSADPAGYREETGLGIRLLYESGFTQGTVGFGFDAHSLSSIKLDSGRGRYGTGQFSQTDDGRGDDTQSEVGGAVKLRISDTVLKYGSQFTSSPVFSTDDSRILPEVATGTYLVSNEIEGLELSAGRFTAMSSQTGTSRDDINGKGEAGLKYANIVGASYAFTDSLSAAFHASDVEDYWKKYYGNVNYNLSLSEEQALNFDVNIYKTDYDKTYTGTGSDEDNTIWSLAVAYSLGAHTFTLAHQRSSGDRGYEYGVDGGGTVWLANSVQYSDFFGKDERSWQARYDLNMAEYGVPGLSFMTRYIYGDNIDVAGFDDEGKEHEFNFETKYVVQDGAAKDLSFRLRSAIWRANSAYNSVNGADNNDLRLIVEYPLEVL